MADKDSTIHVRMTDSKRFDGKTKKRLVGQLAQSAGMDVTAFINLLLDEELDALTDAEVRSLDAAFETGNRFIQQRQSRHESKKAKR